MRKDEKSIDSEVKSIKRMVLVVFVIISVVGLLLAAYGIPKVVGYVSKRYCMYNTQKEADTLVADFNKRRLSNPDKYDKSDSETSRVGDFVNVYDPDTKTNFKVNPQTQEVKPPDILSPEYKCL